MTYFPRRSIDWRITSLFTGGNRSVERDLLDFRKASVWMVSCVPGVGVPRSTVYDWQRQRQATGQAIKRRGRQPGINDADMVAAVRAVLGGTTPASFHGEGYRKVWARLRQRGLRTDKERIRRLMRTHGLLAPMR